MTARFFHGRLFSGKLYCLVAVVLLCMVCAGCGSAKISDADAQYARGEYFEAVSTYRKVYNRLTKRSERPLRGEVAWKMGRCYARLNRPANASAAWKNAKRYGYEDSLINLRLAKSLHAEGKYKESAEAYELFLSEHPEDKEAREGLRGVRRALKGKEQNSTRHTVKIEKVFNSSRSDFSPAFAGKEFDRLYFTSSNEKVTGMDRSPVTGTKRSDIMVSRKDEQGRWLPPEPVGGELNSEADEGVASFSPDGQKMYLSVARPSQNGPSSVEIYTSMRSDATWSAPQRFPIGEDTMAAVGHPAVSPDGEWLYFASDMDGGYGGLDIWRIHLKRAGARPQNLGSQINTPGNEAFPYVRNDSLLYFSSDGHAGFGGLDIYSAHLNSTGDRWIIENLGLPLNSSSDDFGIVFAQGEEGFFSSNRGDARGYDNIYSFVLPDIHVGISGYVLDKDEEPVPGAVIRIVGDDGTIQKTGTRADGSFSFDLDRGVNYVMQAGAPGYLNMKQEFRSDEAEEDAEYEVDFSLVALNKPQVVENIFYDFDRATLRPESKAALDEIVAMLADNPHVAIEMSSHTDRVGSETYNAGLSYRRAKSVVDYLIGAGVSPERLSWKGYGKSKPKTVTRRISRLYPQFEEGVVLSEEYISTLSDEDQKIADQINRRTEFEVTSIRFGLD